MTNHYSSEMLGKYVSVQGGFAFKSSDFRDSGIPVLKIKNVRLRDVDISEVSYVNAEVAKVASNYFCKTGDLLISMTGSGLQAPNSVVGRIARFTGSSDEFLINQRVGRFVVKEPTKVDSRYLFFVLTQREYQWNLVSIATGSANQVNISIRQIEGLEVPLPPLDEQKAIAHILGTLDDKIELNQQLNHTLESVARALFKSWFIDFDPVRAKMDGRQPAGMDAETAALFPAEFEDSALGKIPKGWRVGKLEDLIVLQRGFDLPKTDRTPGKYPVLAASGASGTHSEYKVKGPGVTTGRSGVLGRVFFVHEDFWPLNTSLWIKEFRSSRPIHAYHLLQDLNFEVFNAGSAVPTLNRNHVHGLPVIDAPLAVVEKFEEIAPIFRQSKANEEQSNSITSIRDVLLPKLLSGEIRVQDAEKIVEAVV